MSLLRVAQDTTAYVAQRSGPPDTESYMWAGYAIALVCYIGYIVLMARRIARSTRGD
ncbi:MAG: hypothetical protein IBJ03_10060 [Gemmatimonadaceae bacterium]|nr:hypothetical protein [Gemmatimonadaceae bacterium]